MEKLIESDTRITCTHSFRIDLIFTNVKNIYCAGTLNLNISDHLPIFVIKKKERLRPEYTYVTGHTYKTLDEANYIADIRNIDKNCLFSDLDPNAVWSKMRDHFISVANKHCPLQQMKVTVSRPEYINLELLELMREKDDAFKIARAVKTTISWNHARILKSMVQTHIHNDRKYAARKIADNQGDGH